MLWIYLELVILLLLEGCYDGLGVSELCAGKKLWHIWQ